MRLEISCEASAKQMIHIKCQTLFFLFFVLFFKMSSAAVVLKMRLDISCESSAKQMIHKKCQALFFSSKCQVQQLRLAL